jgi:hypothetical protein
MIQSAEQFVFLRSSDDIDLYQQAANDSATEEIWHDVIKKYPDMKVWVVRNKTVPLSILEILSHEEDVNIRHAVGMKRSCSQDIFQRLSKDPNESVRSSVVFNAKTPKIILEQLLNDECFEIAEKAKNRLEALMLSESQSDKS